MKKAKPSAEKGRPMMLPLKAMTPGQSRPSSNDTAVPDTAPTANRIPNEACRLRGPRTRCGSPATCPWRPGRGSRCPSRAGPRGPALARARSSHDDVNCSARSCRSDRFGDVHGAIIRALMDLGLKGRVVIVTGGASNLGRAISLGFAGEGARVLIADVDLEQAKRVEAEAP